MELFKWLIGGAIGGIIGAILWAVVAFFLEMEVGWVAWGVGILVGAGVSGAAEGKTCAASGMVAAIMAIASLFGGKYAATYLVADKLFDEEITFDHINDEYLVSYIADNVVKELTSEGHIVVWPPEADSEMPSCADDYPEAVWEEAERRWSKFEAEDRVAFRAEVEDYEYENYQAVMGMFMSNGLWYSFSPFDFIFFGLAIITAWRLGSGSEKIEEEVE